MSGNKAGGQKTKATNLKKYGKDFYKRIGELGGKAASKPKGFATFSKEQLQEVAETRRRKQNDARKSEGGL
jgi:hypothetical protein